MPGTTSTALASFSHDQHHETDAAKRKGGRQGCLCHVYTVAQLMLQLFILRWLEET